MTGCPLCEAKGEQLLWADDRLRIIAVNDADYPGYFRVIWTGHCQEMSDLTEADQQYLMRAVFAAEKVLRRFFQPDKVNLASLGNQVPHLHWHVIARWADDPHFPDPIWAAKRREGSKARSAASNERLLMAFPELLTS